MKNPKPVNLITKDCVKDLGWAADARARDGHLVSMQGWFVWGSPHENAVALAEFIVKYATGCEITIYPENIN